MNCSRFGGVLAVLVLAVGAQQGLAQSPAERTMLSAWEDSLDAATGIAEFTKLEPVAKQGSGPAADLRLSLFQARQALARNDRSGLELALGNLNWTALTRKSWPWPEYALATTFVAMERARMQVLASGGQKDGESHVEAAWRHLQEALKNDPDFEPARTFGIAILVAEGDRELRGDERAFLRRILDRETPEADALLVWGRTLRFLGKYDSSLAVFQRAVRAGGDPSRLALERARSLQALGEVHNASVAYWDGVTALTAIGREAYRYDLAWIMDPDSLPAFDKVPLEQLPGWLRRFWDERDAAAVNRPGERLEEHLRRWVYAFEHFRVFNPWRLNMYTRVEFTFEGLDMCIGNDSTLYRTLAREQPSYSNDLRAREPLLDHRGLIYLHHGPPFQIVGGPSHGSAIDFEDQIAPTTAGTGAAIPDVVPDDLNHDCIVNPGAGGVVLTMGPNEGWYYWFDGRWRLINFRGSCALGYHSPTTLTGYLPVTAAGTLPAYLARASLLPEYQAAAMELLRPKSKLPISCHEPILAVIAEARDDSRVAVHTDTDTPPIIRPWTSIVQMFALGHDSNGSGKALLAFGLSGPTMHADSMPDGRVTYSVNFRIAAFDRATGQTITLDTVRHFVRAEPLRKGQSIGALFEIPLGAGQWQVAVRANQGDDSSGVYAMKRDLRVDGGNEFSLSDIVIGRAGSPAWKATDGAPFPVNVLGAYTAGGTAELYYEVHGLRSGENYHTTLVVRGTAPGAKDGIRLLSNDRASGLVTHVRKSLGLQQLKPGSYRMIITVEANGRTATREQPLLIAKP